MLISGKDTTASGDVQRGSQKSVRIQQTEIVRKWDIWRGCKAIDRKAGDINSVEIGRLVTDFEVIDGQFVRINPLTFLTSPG